MIFARYRYSIGGGFRQNLRTGVVQAYDWFYGGGWFAWKHSSDDIRWQ